MKGYVQVYTGDGKGKTTASLEYDVIILEEINVAMNMALVSVFFKGY